jgi:hypothetical protein
VTKVPPGRRAAHLLRRVLPGRKGNAVNPDQKASADLVKAAIWSEDTPGYARESGRHKLVWLLGEVKADVGFESSLHSLPLRKSPSRPSRLLRSGHAR